MAFRRSTRPLNTDMNVANLVDITFALLIIFMIAAPLMTQGVKVDLPKVEAKNIQTQDAIRVSINRKREVFINENEVSFLDFDRDFRILFDGPDVPVIVNADRRVPYGFVVEIVSKLQKSGVEKLSFLTELPPRAGGI